VTTTKAKNYLTGYFFRPLFVYHGEFSMHYFAKLISISFLLISLGIWSAKIAPEVVDWYSMRLEEEDAALKKDFKKALAITDNEWNQAIVEARTLYELYDDIFKEMCEYNGSLSHEIMHIFEKICCEKGIKNSVLALRAILVPFHNRFNKLN
jgi:hypothetical protein